MKLVKGFQIFEFLAYLFIRYNLHKQAMLGTVGFIFNTQLHSLSQNLMELLHIFNKRVNLHSPAKKNAKLVIRAEVQQWVSSLSSFMVEHTPTRCIDAREITALKLLAWRTSIFHHRGAMGLFNVFWVCVDGVNRLWQTISITNYYTRNMSNCLEGVGVI